MAKISATDISSSLKGAQFPMDKDQLVEHARENGAREDVIEMLENLNGDEFGSLSDVEHAFGQAP